MNDIYDERQDMSNTRHLSSKIRERCLIEIKKEKRREPGDRTPQISIDDRSRYTRLINEWPDTDLVRQIIKETAKLMAEFDIRPEDVRW